jgi:hypothetical protein
MELLQKFLSANRDFCHDRATFRRPRGGFADLPYHYAELPAWTNPPNLTVASQTY